MRKRGNWFSALRKALGTEHKGDKSEEGSRTKKKWFRKRSSTKLLSSTADSTNTPHRKSDEVTDEDRAKHSYSVALATAAAAEAAAAAAQAAAEVVRLTNASRFLGKSKEESERTAAIRIQTAFRGYLARRALRALRGLVRLKTMVEAQSVQRQTASSLRYMQNMSRVLSQIHIRRIRVSEENQTIQRQLQQKHERELEKFRSSVGESWNDSTQSKERIEEKIQSRNEAAMRRERALAYAYSHHLWWKNSSNSANPFFMDPNNPRWGWSWLERWVAPRNPSEKDHSPTIHSFSDGDVTRSYARRDANGRKLTLPRIRNSGSDKPILRKRGGSVVEDDSKSLQSERHRRHSIAGSSVRDDESLASSPSVPGYMTPTESARAKARLPSPLGLQKNGNSDQGLTNSAKKKLMFSGSPAAPRRHSGPPRVDTGSVRSINLLLDG